jgi:dTDP-4-dehydrorhamnose reductase
MLEKRLDGLYHVVSSQCTSKYDFGVELARRFGLDERLISPSSVNDSGLNAPRSPKLTLRSGKLARVLGRPIPNFSTGLEDLYRLYQQNYPQKLREMRG